MDAQRSYIIPLMTIQPFNSLMTKCKQPSLLLTLTTVRLFAMIGGHKTGDVQLGYNRAVSSGRSNGSSMKAMMDFAPAIEYLNYSTAQKLQDTAYIYPGTNIQLHDFDNRYLGTITARNALANSRNVPIIRLLEDVGYDACVSLLRLRDYDS